MTKRDRIIVLLEFYPDVLEGLREPGSHCSRGGCRMPPRDRWLCAAHGCSDEGVLALMCAAWNHPSYQELERLRRLLRERWPELSAWLVAGYLRFFERRVAVCAKCGIHPAAAIGSVHRHPPGRSVRLVGHVVRVGKLSDYRRVADAVDWLEAHWRGEAELPRDVAVIESQRRLRGVAAA